MMIHRPIIRSQYALGRPFTGDQKATEPWEKQALRGRIIMGFRRISDDQVEQLDRLQSEYFSKYMHLFDPPLPDGVLERLERIVASAHIGRTDVVLDMGAGTGILIPVIRKYNPTLIYANDLSRKMLNSVKERYPEVKILHGDIRDLELPDKCLDVILVNACYPNIVDKHRSFATMGRMTETGGRVVVSHPMGREFIDFLQKKVPFPLDDFPDSAAVAEELFAPYGFRVSNFVDEDKLYILTLERVEA
ncbi:MAG TPA: class I SAM-dependent methyltransferase [Deltaproteobacteria bacterium]|nr:class I SAM-dependent methyltransferase [Deltaproteobacteria bacterium]